MTDDAIRAVAPSVFAEHAATDVSSRYSFVPTSRVVNGLRDAGWIPVNAREQRVILDDNRGFQKHLLKFHRMDDLPITELGNTRLELSLVNSHDRSSGFQIYAGMFRLACLNGMMVSDGICERISVRHTGLAIDEVVTASLDIAERAPQIRDAARSMRARPLTPIEQLAFAQSALLLKYDDVSESPIPAESLLRAKRYSDNGTDLWNTFNTVQENLIQGGIRGRTVATGKRMTTRAVKSINEDVRLNRALWHLAEALKEGVTV